MVDTYLFDGIDIRTAARILATHEGQYDLPDLSGDDLTISQRDGQYAVTDRTFLAGSFTLPLTLTGSSVTERSDNLRALTRMVRPGRTITVQRQRTYTTGAETHIAICRYVSGLSPTILGVVNARVALTMKVLGGVWDRSTTDTLATLNLGTASRTVLGDTRSRKATITFSGATGGTVMLTNNTNGYWVSYTGATNVTPVVVDTDNATATQGVTNVSQNLNFGKVNVFQLDEGSNSLTVAGGTGSPAVSIVYTPAFL